MMLDPLLPVAERGDVHVFYTDLDSESGRRCRNCGSDEGTQGAPCHPEDLTIADLAAAMAEAEERRARRLIDSAFGGAR